MNLWKILEKHQKILKEYTIQINTSNYQEILSNMYNYIKSVTDIYYNGYQIHDSYIFLVDEIINAEGLFPNKKMIDVPINFGFCPDINEFIEFVVYLTRRYLVKEHCYSYDYNINKVNFTNDCPKASQYIKDLCDKYQIESYILTIYPGYDKKANLFNGGKFHFANIIKYENKYFLVDVTYSQFFYERQNNLDRLGLVKVSGCLPGSFMLMTDTGKDLTMTLLKNGYIELNEEILKTYLDAFTISFRNGLYYESTNDFSYAPPYTFDDYIKFLKGEDSQINHEGEENLGFQKKPLKNWNMKFK